MRKPLHMHPAHAQHMHRMQWRKHTPCNPAAIAKVLRWLPLPWVSYCCLTTTETTTRNELQLYIGVMSPWKHVWVWNTYGSETRWKHGYVHMYEACYTNWKHGSETSCYIITRHHGNMGTYVHMYEAWYQLLRTHTYVMVMVWLCVTSEHGFKTSIHTRYIQSDLYWPISEVELHTNKKLICCIWLVMNGTIERGLKASNTSTHCYSNPPNTGTIAWKRGLNNILIM